MRYPLELSIDLGLLPMTVTLSERVSDSEFYSESERSDEESGVGGRPICRILYHPRCFASLKHDNAKTLGREANRMRCAVDIKLQEA